MMRISYHTFTVLVPPVQSYPKFRVLKNVYLLKKLIKGKKWMLLKSFSISLRMYPSSERNCALT